MSFGSTQPDYIDPAGDARDGSLPVRPPFPVSYTHLTLPTNREV